MFFLCFLLSLGLLAHAQSSILLGYIPLIVKTPYLHCWVRSNSQTAPEQVWPTLFAPTHSLGWMGMVRVDGQPYQWLGSALTSIANFSKIVAGSITPTKTIFTIQAGPMKFNVSFFSPIESDDYIRQSVPFTYVFADAFTANDGRPHTIQLYADISAEWVSHDPLTNVTWDTQNTDNMVYHHVAPASPQSLKEDTNYAEDGTGYHATPMRSGLTWQTGADVDCRTNFSRNGSLGNSKDTHFRAINDSFPVFSFAIDLGSITPNNQPDPVVWAVGLVRDPLVNYVIESGFQRRTGFYWSAYQRIDDVISDFFMDFPNARQRGQNFDDRVLSAALQVSSEYAGIVSLVTRQVFASMDITIPTGEGGQPSASDVKIFMKDIGMSTRANPVEVIYAALPALLYFNASIVHDLLLPLLEYQSSSKYPNPYASPDLGAEYPVISGNTNKTETFAIEHCGNMLIMTYTHAAKSGDRSLVSQYHPLLQKWADYLVQNSFNTDNAKSADGFGYPGMSNLALKGILGVYSMGKIDEILNLDNTTFRDKANELIASWKKSAVNETHIQAEYGNPSTWGLMYNLFPAMWLQTGLIDDDILNHEAQFYSLNQPLPDQSYILDSEQVGGIAYPHWALMTAAIIPSDFVSVRNTLIQSTYIQAYNVTQPVPLPMKYTASTGAAVDGSATGSAAQGAVFAILAMGMKNVNISPVSPGGNVNAEKKSPVGAIVGGVIGGLAFLLVVASAIFLWRRRRVQQPRIVIDPHHENNAQPQPFLTQYAPVNTRENMLQFPKQYSAAGLTPPTFQAPLVQRGSESYIERSYPVTTPPTPPFQPLSSKPSEALQQSVSHRYQPSESAVSTLTNPYSSSGSGREDVLRAEVDELRREMEVIRNITQPPPSYGNALIGDGSH